MADDPVRYLVAGRTEDSMQPIPSSVIRACEECERDVWVSPATIIAAPRDAAIICVQCFSGYHGSTLILPETRGQAEERRRRGTDVPE